MLSEARRKTAADAEQLRKRVSELEGALQRLQATVSDDPHPLLRGDKAPAPIRLEDPPPASSSSASGSTPPQADSSSSPTTIGSTPPQTEEASDEEADSLDAYVGTLTLGTRGEARFFGQTSRSEYLIHAPERLAAYAPPTLPRLTNISIDEANKELDVFCTSNDVADDIMKCLPPISKAMHLCEMFFEYSKFLWFPVPRDYIMDEVIPLFYHPEAYTDKCHVAKKHGIALLCMIFALAMLFDTNMPPYAAEAHEWYLIARIALRWAPPAYDTTLASLQALIYMSLYLEMSDCEPAHTGSHKAWMQIRQATSLGQSIGLHVNSRKWQLDHEAAAKRGRIFWQLATYDAWLSFGYGRPPSISLSFVDCDVPKEADAVVNEEDGTYHAWCWQFTRVMHAVMTATSGAKPPTYAKVFELDRRIRDFPVPPALRIPCGPQEKKVEPIALTMQRLLVTVHKETTLLNLHRPYFSLAVKEASDDPLRHKYGASVLSIYRSAWRILTTMQSAYRAAPGITSRYGLVWSHSLACAILLCLLITRASKSTLAAPCLIELDKICALFEDAAGQSQVASNNLEVIRKLRKQAQTAMTNVRVDDAAAIAQELDRLGGKTQLIQTVGERELHCPSRPTPVKTGPTSFEVTSMFAEGNTYGAQLQPTVALDTDMLSFDAPGPVNGNGNVNGAQLNGFQTNGNGHMNGVPMDAAPFDFGFPLSGGFPDMVQGQAGAPPMADFDLSGGVAWDPSLNGWLPSNADFLQPNVADAEATWQALVEQLGI
ncbi:hypothetical protein TRAPUB_4785 [Trametes pubescens]|uniref:Xylanolytic transcriptional activator regulatory domain-containing protein n=1 Tax=Trametes pubescens TaxID=154538 RepID=A0A1M2VAF5_TRAPU|nr:hypothetical protein TRAPUB_4785 [Trametes pubescens]